MILIVPASCVYQTEETWKRRLQDGLSGRDGEEAKLRYGKQRGETHGEQNEIE